MLLWVGCGTETKSVAGDLGTTDSQPSETHQASDVLVEDHSGSSHETTPVTAEDVLLPSWCESFCSGLEYGCPDGQAFSTEDCLGGCVPSAVGECSQEWASAEVCIAVDADWSCGDVGHASPADGSCTEELAELRTCLGPPDPCIPTPCGPHETCILDDAGDAYCSSDAEEWCTAITMGMKEACPDFLKNPEMHIALCIQNAQGPCALECAIVRDCVPADAEWICDPAKGILPKDEACMEELMTMHNCTIANGSVP